ncbi:MAG: hypothetical protein ACQEXJ_01960 [Myxococcota bacterium]
MAEETWTVGLYGASGALGRQVTAALEGEGLPVDHLVAVGGARSAGTPVGWRGRRIALVNPGEVDPSDLDVAILATPDDVADDLRGPLSHAGALVIDLSGTGTAAGLPLVWPSLDPEALEEHPGGFAVPCAPAGTLAPVLDALATLGAPAEVHATVLLGAAASGREGEEALSRQTFALLNHQLPDPAPFDGVLAFNALAGSTPGGISDDPWETHAVDQVRRLLPGLADTPLLLDTVQVPMFSGVGVTLAARWEGDTPTRAQVEEALDARDDLIRAPGRTAVRDAMEMDEILVGRLRTSKDGVVRCFLAADGVHRTAEAVAALLARVVRDDLW